MLDEFDFKIAGLSGDFLNFAECLYFNV